MKKLLLHSCLALLLGLHVFQLQAQSSEKDMATEELERYKVQVEDLVRYFEGTLNFLGDPANVAREKEIIINDSYLKIFKDDKVQIEDDLDESREVPLHKDVQAYLKDIEFFFREVRFSFVVSDIAYNSNEGGLNFFKVTLNRELIGHTVDGDSVSNKKVRFMEVNLDIGSGDLRIASMYTTKLNEKEEIRNWWNGLSSAWKDFLGAETTVYDSILLSEIYFIADSLILLSSVQPEMHSDTVAGYQIEMPPEREISTPGQELDSVPVHTGPLFRVLYDVVKQTQLDISGNEFIRDLSPVAELSGLTRLNCSHTTINNLSPLRNLNKLEVLNISNTPVDDLSALQYTTSLKELECGYTLIEDLTAIGGLYNLEKLDCSGLRIQELAFVSDLSGLRELILSETKIHDLSALSQLTDLVELDLSATGIRDLKGVVPLINLRSLNAESTSITDAEPLEALEKLEVLKISYTGIENLEPLNGLPELKRIYWDSNGDFNINKEEKRKTAIKFMKDHEGSLVIFESEALKNGWAALEEPWKEIARSIVSISEVPTKEELHSLLQIEEVVIDTTPITTLQPVASLYKLKKLSVQGMQLKDYEAVGEALEMEYLNLSYTSVSDIDFAKTLKSLKELKIDGTAVKDLSALEALDDLRYVYADSSGVDEKSVQELKKKNPDCVVLFKSSDLNTWWNALPKAWSAFFVDKYNLDASPTNEQLHELYYLEELVLTDASNVQTIDPIRKLANLKVIKFSKLDLGSLQVVSSLPLLEELYCSEMPVNDLTPLANLRTLEVLSLENLPVEDLSPIESLSTLKKLNISGTQVKSVKVLSGLTALESVELNNTQVKKISPLSSLPAIKHLSCFNTRVSQKSVEKFRTQKPNCKVVYY